MGLPKVPRFTHMPKQQTTRQTRESTCDRQRGINSTLELEMSNMDVEGYERGTQ
jgi:hypothetical protein